MAMMQTKGAHIALLQTEEPPNGLPPPINMASKEEKNNHKVLKDAKEKVVLDIKEKRNNV